MHLAVDGAVVLAEERAPLRVADEHPVAAHAREHARRDRARVRARVLEVRGLAAHAHAAAERRPRRPLRGARISREAAATTLVVNDPRPRPSSLVARRGGRDERKRGDDGHVARRLLEWQCAHTRRCARSPSFSVVGFIFQLAAMNGRRRDVAAGGARWTAAEACAREQKRAHAQEPHPTHLGSLNDEDNSRRILLRRVQSEETRSARPEHRRDRPTTLLSVRNRPLVR